MSTTELFNYWLKSAAEDVITADSLFNSKRYLPCLFYCHLLLEKTLKAAIVKKTNQSGPFIHQLTRLAELSQIAFSTNQLELLAEVTAFNIKARYEDYKFALYKKATSEYTRNYLIKTKELHSWIKSQI